MIDFYTFLNFLQVLIVLASRISRSLPQVPIHEFCEILQAVDYSFDVHVYICIHTGNRRLEKRIFKVRNKFYFTYFVLFCNCFVQFFGFLRGQIGLLQKLVAHSLYVLCCRLILNGFLGCSTRFYWVLRLALQLFCGWFYVILFWCCGWFYMILFWCCGWFFMILVW